MFQIRLGCLGRQTIYGRSRQDNAGAYQSNSAYCCKLIVISNIVCLFFLSLQGTDDCAKALSSFCFLACMLYDFDS